MKEAVDYTLYLVTDRPLCRPKALCDVVREAVLGGVTVVQLREKHCTTVNFVRIAERLLTLLRSLGIPLIINDRIDIAHKVGADGVHLGQSDNACEEAREVLGPDAIIGYSVETLEQAQKAQELDIDYLGVSPIFVTSTKPELTQAWGLDGLARLRDTTRLPLVAIGGMDASNAAAVRSAGADGIAVVSAICAAPDPRAAAQTLRRAMRTDA